MSIDVSMGSTDAINVRVGKSHYTNVSTGNTNTINVRLGQSQAVKVVSTGVDINVPQVKFTGGIVAGITTFENTVEVASLNVTGISSLGVTNISDASLQQLSVSGLSTFSGGRANTFIVEDLTDNRIVLAGSGGELEDDANLTFDGSTLEIGVGLDVDGQTNLDDLIISGVSTFNSSAYFGDNDRIYFDNNQLILYAASDLPTIALNGGNTNGGYIILNGGKLQIRKDAHDGDQLATFNVDGGIDLYHNNSKKFETIGSGVTIFGNTETQELNVTGISTFADASTFQNGVSINGQLTVDSTLFYSELSGTNIDATGIASITTLDISGISTFSNTLTVGTATTGIVAKTDGSLTVSGISTFSNDVIFDSVGKIQLPVGTSAERTAGVAQTLGQLRYNTELSVFEGYGGGNVWRSFGNTIDADGDTFLRVESTAGSDEDTLEFITDNEVRVAITSVGNFGIGITNPSSLFEVQGNSRFIGITTFGDRIHILDNDAILIGGPSAGSTGEFKIYHNDEDDGNYIENIGIGSIIFLADNLLIRNQANTTGIASFTEDGFQVSGVTSTTKLHVGVDTGFHNEDLVVTGNARVTGILSIGTGTIVIDPDNDDIMIKDSKITRNVSTGDIEFRSTNGNNELINIRAKKIRSSGLEEDDDGNLNVTGIITAASLDVTGKLQSTGIGISVSNGSASTATIAGPSNIIIDPGVVGDNTGTVRIKGDLFVDGTQTQINSSIIELSDFVVGVATTATSDALADGSGFEFGPNDNNLKYYYNSGTNPSLKSSENLNVASGKVYQINQTEVLSATSLGTGITNSSLTSVGTLNELNISGIATLGSDVTVTGTLTAGVIDGGSY